MTTVMIAVEEILENWSSCDGASAGGWDWLLEGKRVDSHYPDIVESIRENGLLVPFYADISQQYWGDGHHRLAACIDLGMTEVPVVDSDGELHIASDSGYWRAGKPVLDPRMTDRSGSRISDLRSSDSERCDCGCMSEDDRTTGDMTQTGCMTDSDWSQALGRTARMATPGPLTCKGQTRLF